LCRANRVDLRLRLSIEIWVWLHNWNVGTRSHATGTAIPVRDGGGGIQAGYLRQLWLLAILELCRVVHVLMRGNLHSSVGTVAAILRLRRRRLLLLMVLRLLLRLRIAVHAVRWGSVWRLTVLGIHGVLRLRGQGGDATGCGRDEEDGGRLDAYAKEAVVVQTLRAQLYSTEYSWSCRRVRGCDGMLQQNDYRHNRLGADEARGVAQWPNSTSSRLCSRRAMVARHQSNEKKRNGGWRFSRSRRVFSPFVQFLAARRAGLSPGTTGQWDLCK